MSLDIVNLNINKTINSLKKGDFSCNELISEFIKRIDLSDKLNCFITKTPEKALEMAKATDAKIAKKEKLGLLEGIPIAIKDLFCTKNIKTTAGSKILNNFVPTYESFVTQRILNSGSVFLGKLNCDEFAMGSSNETSYFGNVLNPWKEKGSEKFLVPGGSSGGSAAAVAANLCLGSIGTDTGGSIRQPAALTGTVGIKPTYGLCSRWGIVAFASSLDQAGPIAKSVEDAAILLEVIAGHDPRDSTSVDYKVPNYSNFDKSQTIKNLKIGIPKEYRIEGMPEEVESIWNKGIAWLKDSGVTLVDISLPHTQYALPAYYILAPAEASSNLARYDGVRFGLRVEGGDLLEMYEKTRSEGFGDEVKRRILIGTFVLSSGYYDAYYLQAQKLRTLIKSDFDEAFDKVDAILTPTAPYPAFGVDEKLSDPISMYLNDVFTVPVNLAGLPAMSIPAGLSKKGLPLGLQVIGNYFEEKTILNIAKTIEQSAGINAKPDFWWSE